MTVRSSIAMSVILSLLCSVTSAEQTPRVNKALADNAALVYWQAFSLMPELDESATKSLDDVLAGKKPDAQISKTLRQANESLRLLRRAKDFPQIEWALEYDRGIELGLPHVSQARELSKLACARARVRFAEGDNQAAIEDILATLFMTRKIGKDPVVVNLLVGYAIEQLATDALLQYLPNLEPSELGSLAAGIDGLPEAKNMTDGWRMEKELVLGWFIGQLRKPDNKNHVLKMFGDKSDPNVAALMKMSQKECLDAAIKLRSVYDEVARVLGSSPDEVDVFFKKMSANADSLGPSKHFAALLISEIKNSRRSEAVHQARSVMLTAAIAVAKSGQNALTRDELRDPFGEGPLQYKTTSNGFQLSSMLLGRDNKRVTLTVGGE